MNNVSVTLDGTSREVVTLFCGSGEMADTQVLGTCVFGRAGSSPASRTRFFGNHKWAGISHG